jgi:hypothetical protein
MTLLKSDSAREVNRTKTAKQRGIQRKEQGRCAVRPLLGWPAV